MRFCGTTVHPQTLHGAAASDLYSVPLVGQEALCEEEVGYDPKDPNRPRFTLQELRDVLHERNELKAKVFMLQEEIAYYKRSAMLPAIFTDSLLASCIIKVTQG